jgi:DNA-binding winged helix-turn-helix (wHTH) protein/tetratricopeptide (TPR) repeat protein
MNSRQAGNPTYPRYQLADLTIDLEVRSVHRNAVAVKLPALSFDVLALLVTEAPGVVGAAMLAERVWRNPQVSNDTITQRITLLRHALGDDAGSPRYIRTVRSRGYACAGTVMQSAAPSAVRLRSRSRLAVAAGAALVALTGIALLAFPGAERRSSGAPAPLSGPPDIATSSVKRAQALLQVQQADETERAIHLLRAALALEPNNSELLVTLSFGLSTRTTKFRGSGQDAAEAESLARRALARDYRSAGAWHALGYALDAEGRVDEALAAYRRAYEANPADLAAMSSSAYLQSVRGRLFEALVLEAQAMRSKDYSRYADVQIARVLDLVGHPAAEAWSARARLLNPNQVVVIAETARAALRAGRPAAALEILAEASGAERWSPRLLHLEGRAALTLGDTATAKAKLAAAGDSAAPELAALAALEGDRSFAEAQVTELERSMLDGDSWPGTRVALAELHAALGDEQEALRQLSAAVDLGWRDTGNLEHSPFLQAVMMAQPGVVLRLRIERELAVQRMLIETAPELAGLLAVGGAVAHQ